MGKRNSTGSSTKFISIDLSILESKSSVEGQTVEQQVLEVIMRLDSMLNKWVAEQKE